MNVFMYRLSIVVYYFYFTDWKKCMKLNCLIAPLQPIALGSQNQFKMYGIINLHLVRKNPTLIWVAFLVSFLGPFWFPE